MAKRIVNAIIYRANGQIEQVEAMPANNQRLAYLQGVVGGYIEKVRTRDGRDMYIDEEGKLEGKPKNLAATHLYRYGAQDPIVGDAIVIGTPRYAIGAEIHAQAEQIAQRVRNAKEQSL